MIQEYYRSMRFLVLSESTTYRSIYSHWHPVLYDSSIWLFAKNHNITSCKCKKNLQRKYICIYNKLSHLSVKYHNSCRYRRNKSTTVQSATAPCGCAIAVVLYPNFTRPLYELLDCVIHYISPSSFCVCVCVCVCAYVPLFSTLEITDWPKDQWDTARKKAMK